MRHIRNKFGDIIYCIRDDGTITDKFDCDVIGHLKGDRITDKFDIDTLYRIRQDGTITDKYDCDIIGHIREDGSITDKYDIDTQGRVDVPHYSSGSSDSGCLMDILSLIWHLACAVVMLAIKLLPYLFLYVYFPLLSSATIYYMVAMVVFGIVLRLDFLMPPIAILASIVLLTSIPYWVILFTQKRKRKMKWGATLKYYGKWLIKGPWAYKDIIELKNRPLDK